MHLCHAPTQTTATPWFPMFVFGSASALFLCVSTPKPAVNMILMHFMFNFNLNVDLNWHWVVSIVIEEGNERLHQFAHIKSKSLKVGSDRNGIDQTSIAVLDFSLCKWYEALIAPVCWVLTQQFLWRILERTDYGPFGGLCLASGRNSKSLSFPTNFSAGNCFHKNFSAASVSASLVVVTTFEICDNSFVFFCIFVRGICGSSFGCMGTGKFWTKRLELPLLCRRPSSRWKSCLTINFVN